MPKSLSLFKSFWTPSPRPTKVSRHGPNYTRLQKTAAICLIIGSEPATRHQMVVSRPSNSIPPLSVPPFISVIVKHRKFHDKFRCKSFKNVTDACVVFANAEAFLSLFIPLILSDFNVIKKTKTQKRERNKLFLTCFLFDDWWCWCWWRHGGCLLEAAFYMGKYKW